MVDTPPRRTELLGHGKLVTHAESIALIKAANRKAAPELKTYTQGSGMPAYDEVRAKVVQEYKDAGMPPDSVWLQSLHLADLAYWLQSEPEYGKQAVFLDISDTCNASTAGCEDVEASPMADGFASLRAIGVEYIAPPIQTLVKAVAAPKLYAPSDYAVAAKAAGLKLITWTLERGENHGFGASGDATMFNLLDTLHRDVGVKAVFSDWPATTTFYANCAMVDNDDGEHEL